MLAAKRLPVILQNAVSRDVEAVCLMTVEGSILASASHTLTPVCDEITLAAVSSSVWNNYSQGNGDISLHIVKLDEGFLGIAAIGKNYLIAAVGRSCPGLLRTRLLQLSQYFQKVFDLIK